MTNGGAAPVEDIEVKDAQIIFQSIWSSLEEEVGSDNMRFPKEIFWLNGAPGAGKGTQTAFIMEFRDLTEQMKDSGRGFIVDHDINPWVPIAMADLCIGMPFTSPPLAGMHYRIPGLFHDPTGVALHHKHQSLSHSITHDYEQLKSRVRSMAFESPRSDGNEELVWSETQEFTGGYPGTNSSDRFRDILCDIAKTTS